MESARTSLIQSFLTVVRENSGGPAVVEGGKVCTYRDLYTLAHQVYAGILQLEPVSAIGIFGGRSLLSYAAIWASIFAGLPYVPLNPALPPGRLKQIARQSGLDCCIVSNGNAQKLTDCLPELLEQFLCVDPDYARDTRPQVVVPPAVTVQETAYILFTSGSTGIPKGVPISYANLQAFVDNVNKIIDYRHTDRVAQVCETSFDFSVHEIYLALLNGACLYPARDIDLFNPAQYIDKHQLSIWHSVPSLVNVALNNSRLEDGALGSIRHTVFNGEPLTQSLARRWRQVASNSQVWNFYGPTECTVAVSSQEVTDSDESICRENNIAIGRFFDGCLMAILWDGRVINQQDITEGVSGELLIGGLQTFAGYLDKEVASPFIYDDSNVRFYRTGDLVLWQNERLYILGRLDYQVKIGGYRIELLEIEHQLKNFFNNEMLAVIAVPLDNPEKLVVCSEVELDLNLLKKSDITLPSYMIPSKVVVIDQLPRNQNGKIDRKSIMAVIGGER